MQPESCLEARLSHGDMQLRGITSGKQGALRSGQLSFATGICRMILSAFKLGPRKEEHMSHLDVMEPSAKGNGCCCTGIMGCSSEEASFPEPTLKDFAEPLISEGKVTKLWL